MKNQTQIAEAAQNIFNSLRPTERKYAAKQAKATGQTPFSCLHDLMDANELLPEDSIKWDAEGGPDCTEANAIMDAFNALFNQGA